MNRLTNKKVLANFKAIKNISPDYVASSEELIYAKLCELEDLEEQIGCPLEVVFKALTNGVYVKDFPNESNTLKMFGLNLTNIENEWYMITKFYANVKVKDYKKTWWLRKDKSE